MSPASNSTKTILVVDDDPLTLKSLQMILSGDGREVTTADNGMIAQDILLEHGLDYFECVLTDYRMPEFSGLDLLEWITSRDSSLSSIILTGEGEKDLVARALRGGAVDFMEKPFTIEEIRKAVEEAIELTRKNRVVESTVSDVKGISQLSKRLAPNRLLATGEIQSYQTRLTTRFLPIKETGGDFINVHPIDKHRMLLLAGDVSGHDLKAGFISAYFQGIVRGMVQHQPDITHICEYFNRFLINEWNLPDNPNETQIIRTSLAACLGLIDFENKTLEIFNHGLPLPWLHTQNGTVKKLGGAGPPLGWFDPLATKTTVYELEENAQLFFWSDGLEDYAEALQIQPLSLAYALLHEEDENKQNEIVANRKDDVIAIRLEWNKPDSTNEPNYLIYARTFPGNAHNEIDKQQESWRRHLQFTIPNLNPLKLDEILLCTREAALNAFKHGCQNSSEYNCQILFRVNNAHTRIEVIVSHDGQGIPQEELNRTELKEGNDGHISFGLIIIRSYASTLNYLNDGKTIKITFTT